MEKKTKEMLLCYECNNISNEVVKDINDSGYFDADTDEEISRESFDTVTRCPKCLSDNVDYVVVEEDLYKKIDGIKIPSEWGNKIIITKSDVAQMLMED